MISLNIFKMLPKFAKYIISILVILYIAAIMSVIRLNVNFDYKLSQVKTIDLHELHFQSYIKKYSKKYNEEEYPVRLENFKESLKEISRLNRNPGSANYGPTKFSDMTLEEFEKNMLMKYGYECQPYESRSCLNEVSGNDSWQDEKLEQVLDVEIPKFDWRTQGVVGPVLDQKYCASCWAFSVVGVMESKVVIDRLRSYERLSVQELTDCSETTNHCEGGNSAFAMKYLCQQKLPVTLEREYPLTLVDETCRFRPKAGVRVKSFRVRCNVEPEEIRKLLRTQGPLTAAVNTMTWAYYLNGIIQYHCSGAHYSELRHVVQIVGYDMTTDPPHFIVKNSWGSDYGIDGYLKIAMGNYTCGIGRQIGYLDVVV